MPGIFFWGIKLDANMDGQYFFRDFPEKMVKMKFGLVTVIDTCYIFDQDGPTTGFSPEFWDGILSTEKNWWENPDCNKPLKN